MLQYRDVRDTSNGIRQNCTYCSLKLKGKYYNSLHNSSKKIKYKIVHVHAIFFRNFMFLCY